MAKFKHEWLTLLFSSFMFQAWTLWKEKNALQLIDSSIKDLCAIPEALRCIHVSLLCLQQYPEDRPTMTSVIQMLGSEMELVEPKEPGFFPRRISDEEKFSSNLNHKTSNDELTITSLTGRWKFEHIALTHNFDYKYVHSLPKDYCFKTRLVVLMYLHITYKI